MPSGSQLVSTTATIGMPSRRPSATAMCSRLTSTRNIAAGSLVISRKPSSDFRYRSTSREMRERSFFDNSFHAVSSACSTSCSLKRSSDFFTVRKLVSVPPSQRLLTKSWLARSDSICTGAAACRLVPTKSTLPPPAVTSRRKSSASWKRSSVWSRSTM
jgi:hypothetical protein